ncbi:MAG: tRNA (N6-isopentenyl adenosine(37)-C2)-methylthiotransferase MiaB [Alphaproteobacteria bacterium]|nr:tRNA (N6-isopentenyl adenosine(37)-C2)-methylthiotransferase MiaB [Alphaproteobacteria bacterium]
MSAKKLYIKTWGCQMNVYDSHRIADVLRPLGYELSDTPEDSDMMVLNTCHIREKATEKVFSELGRLKEHKIKKESQGDTKVLMAVAGCVAQAEGNIITQRAPFVDLVFGPQTYHRLPEMVSKLTGFRSGTKNKRHIDTDFPAEGKFDFLPEETQSQGSSAFLSVQEGCDKFCTFCVVPYTRGAEFSRPVQSILDEALSLVDKGAKEINLLGQNVNAYHGADKNGNIADLAHLLHELSQINGLERLRYTTSHPRDMNKNLIDAHGSIKELMPYLHLPIQSGSNKMLEAMNRKHDTQMYLDIIDNLRKIRPDIAFSSDFIVGFPGETEQDHLDTMELVKKVNYAACYSFKYSARPGTPAANMRGLVREDVKTERLIRLQELLGAQQKKFNESQIGKILPVLLDRKGRDEGQLHGRSPYNQAVHVKASPRLLNEIVSVKIKTATQSSLTGEIITSETESTATKAA